MKTLSLCMCALALGACGYTDEGDGSGTLEVNAEAAYRADHDRTDFTVEVQKGGETVNGATITFTDDETNDVFTLEQDGNGNGNRYRFDVAGYHRRLAMRVEHDDGNLIGQLEGPGTHVIDTPVNQASVTRGDLGDQMSVEWSTKDGVTADHVQIAIDGGDPFETTLGEDPGEFDDIPTSGLEPGQHEVEVRRWNEVSLAGGVSGSSFILSYSARNSFNLTN